MIIIVTNDIIVVIALMSTLTRTMIQEALDAASSLFDLKQWTAILPFLLCHFVVR